MSFTDLFESGEHRSNLGHFASLVYIAESHSGIVESELALLQRFANHRFRLRVLLELRGRAVMQPSFFAFYRK